MVGNKNHPNHIAKLWKEERIKNQSFQHDTTVVFSMGLQHKVETMALTQVHWIIKVGKACKIQPSVRSCEQCRSRRIITTLVLLTTLFLVQDRMPLAFSTWAHRWLTFSCLSANTSTAFSSRQLASHCSKPVMMHGVFATEMHYPVLGLAELHPIGLSSSIQAIS